MNRRAFLKFAAAAPCVFGLRDLLAQEPPDLRPAWFKDALARMKERKLHGVVVIAPSADPAQKQFGVLVRDLVEGAFPAVHELMLTSAFIFMTPAVAEACGVRKADEESTRFLLDPDGKRVAADSPDPKSVENDKSFVESFVPFVHGENGDRLKALSLEVMGSVTAKVFKAMVDLGADELLTREVASADLVAHAADLVPYYAWKRRTASDPEVASRLLAVIETHYRSLPGTVPPRLPFGTRVPKFADRGCGSMRELAESEAQPDRPMVACGMGRIDASETKAFLRFLTK